MPYRINAVCRTRATSLPQVGPGTSAFIIYKVWAPDLGSTASTNTSTPMPPTQWVKLRQNSIPRLKASTSVRMLAPVVVKPDTVSNKASTNLGISPESTKGSAPNTDSKIQESPTMKKPSRA